LHRERERERLEFGKFEELDDRYGVVFPKDLSSQTHTHTDIYGTVVWEGELNFTLYKPSSSGEFVSPFREADLPHYISSL
jgi:hypothetical protein